MARKKFSRMRGTRSQGFGRKKRKKGAGNRGGRGMAGTGKRAAQKKTLILKKYGRSYFGKKGFSSKVEKGISINLRDLTSLENKKDGDYVIYDLEKLGYRKLLGSGKFELKAKVTCKSFSARAKKKIEGLGGEAIQCQ